MDLQVQITKFNQSSQSFETISKCPFTTTTTTTITTKNVNFTREQLNFNVNELVLTRL